MRAPVGFSRYRPWYAGLVSGGPPVNLLQYAENSRLSAATVWTPSRELIEVPDDTARFDHDPATGEALGLLVERGATNGHTNSLLETPVTRYTITDAEDLFLPGAKVLTTDTPAPNLVRHTDLGNLYPFGTEGGALSGLRVLYAREGLSRYVSLRTAAGNFGFTFDLESREIVAGSVSGTSINPTARRLSGGWWELSFIEGWGTASHNQYLISFGAALDGALGITSEIGDQIAIAYPSMYDTDSPVPPSILPTNGASATRANDNYSVPVEAFPFSPTTGAFEMRVTPRSLQAAQQNALIASDDADVFVGIDAAASAWIFRAGTGVISVPFSAVPFTLGQTYEISAEISLAERRLTVNGETVTGSGTNWPANNAVLIGRTQAGTGRPNMHLQRLRWKP